MLDKQYTIVENELYYGEECICNFIPCLEKIEQVTDLVTGNITNIYIVVVKVAGENKTSEYRCLSMTDIPYEKIWRECVGAEMLNKKQKRLLSEYLKNQIKDAPKTELCCFNSWGNFNYGVNDNADKILSLEEKEYLKKLLSVKKGISEVLFVCKVAALLKPMFYEAGYSMDFSLMIYGRSGVGKTLLAKLFFVEGLEQERNFKLNSQRDIVEALSEYTSNTVLIDDYHPEALDYGRKRQQAIMDLIARQANKADSALAVITAEMREGYFSAQDRMLQIEIQDKKLDWEIFDYLQNNKDIYVSILSKIIRKVYENRDEVKKELCRYLSNIEEKQGEYRIIYYIYLLKACVHILEEILSIPTLNTLYGIIEPEQLNVVLDEIKRKQCRYMKSLEEKECRGEVNWVELLYRLIYEDEIFKRIPFNSDFSKMKYEGLAIGVADNRLYISRQTLKKGLERYFQENVKVNMMVNALVSEEILEEENNSRAHMKKKRGENYYVIKAKALKSFHRYLMLE